MLPFVVVYVALVAVTVAYGGLTRKNVRAIAVVFWLLPGVVGAVSVSVVFEFGWVAHFVFVSIALCGSLLLFLFERGRVSVVGAVSLASLTFSACVWFAEVPSEHSYGAEYGDLVFWCMAAGAAAALLGGVVRAFRKHNHPGHKPNPTPRASV